MSYDMSFKGAFQYQNKRRAKKALKQFRKYDGLEQSVVQEENLSLELEFILVEYFGSGPASFWETSCGAIEALSEFANGGYVNAEYDSGEGEEFIFRVRLLHGGEEEEIDRPFEDMSPSIVSEQEQPEEEEPKEALSYAAWQGDIDKVRKLLAQGIDATFAVEGAARHSALLKIVLEAGGDPNGTANPNDSPLCNAASYGDLESTKMLLEAGATPDGSYPASTLTPLMMAAEKLAVPVVLALLKAGANPNAQDDIGQTPLMHAVMYANEEVLEISKAIVEAGATVELEDKQGETVLDIAKRNLGEDLFAQFRSTVSK